MIDSETLDMLRDWVEHNRANTTIARAVARLLDELDAANEECRHWKREFESAKRSPRNEGYNCLPVSL